MASSKKGKAPAFVFDAVCHIFNFDPKNALGQPGQMFNEHLYAFHQLLTRAGEPILNREQFMRERKSPASARHGCRGDKEALRIRPLKHDDFRFGHILSLPSSLRILRVRSAGIALSPSFPPGHSRRSSFHRACPLVAFPSGFANLFTLDSPLKSNK
jgi:hypothetical protein